VPAPALRDLAAPPPARPPAWPPESPPPAARLPFPGPNRRSIRTTLPSSRCSCTHNIIAVATESAAVNERFRVHDPILGLTWN
jgi:hypothetical protein